MSDRTGPSPTTDARSPLPESPRLSPPALEAILGAQRGAGNAATARMIAGLGHSAGPPAYRLARTINYKPDAAQRYARSSNDLVDELAAEFYYLERKTI